MWILNGIQVELQKGEFNALTNIKLGNYFWVELLWLQIFIDV